jgi:hypothetical protein
MLTAVCACGRVSFDELHDAKGDAFIAASGLAIAANTNLWGAGHAVPPEPGGAGAGVLPPMITLPPGRGRVLRVTDVGGTIDFGPGPTDADGIDETTLNAAIPYGGLVDVSCLQWNALLAVFLGAGEPADPAPPSLTVDATAETIADIGLHQFFFVGDGLTGSGARQAFAIPDDATRMYLGFGDAAGNGQPPGAYGDNVGSITATLLIE